MASKPRGKRPTAARTSAREALYFAYGSNLSPAQMQARCPGALIEARATLSDYAIAFGGFSARWGGGVASLVRVRGACTEGLIYRIDRDLMSRLDQYEGVPRAYVRIAKEVLDEHGRRRRAQVYLQTDASFESENLPSARYLAQILAAYDRLGFDTDPLRAAVGGFQ